MPGLGPAANDMLRKVYVEPEGSMEWETFTAAVDGLAPAAGGIVAFMGLGEPRHRGPSAAASGPR